MKKSPLALQRCSVAQTLALVGEWWTLLIVREAFFGTRRFGDFQARLGVAGRGRHPQSA
jgi:DNA-binding HxlR family transcriptional regulator